MNPFEISGYWWIPDNLDSRTPGRLSFDFDVGARLRLIGSLLDETQTLQIMGNWGLDYSPDVILGIAENGKEYTLTQCALVGTRTNNGFMTTELAPHLIIEGRHFNNLESLIFAQMSVKLSHLDHWYGVTGKSLQIGPESENPVSINFTYTKPQPLEIIIDGGKVRLGHSWSHNYPNLSHDFVLSEGVGFNIVPDTPFHLSEFFDDWLSLVHGWLALCVGRPITTTELSGKAQVAILAIDSSDMRDVKSVSFYRKTKRHEDEDNYLIPHEMVCCFRDLGTSFDECFRKWVALFRNARPAVQLYLSDLISGTSVFPDAFLGAVRATEAYHRYKRHGTEIPPDEHQFRVNSIIDSAPQEHRTWLEETLRYSNEKRLYKRLRELFAETKHIFDFSGTNIDSIAHKIAQARNQFTHPEANQDGVFASTEDLYKYSQLLRWTITACLLEEVGLPKDLVATLLARNQRFTYFKEVILKKRTVEVIQVISRADSTSDEATAAGEENN